MASSDELPQSQPPDNSSRGGSESEAPATQLPALPLPAPDASTPSLGVLLVLLVAALAFLLASFPARNPDLWQHLAAGRRVAHGAITSGADPAHGARADEFWLFDLLCYGFYSAVGGTGLVLAKALLVVTTALVLFRLSRAGSGWILPAACTALALLAMSTRLLAQPATVSYLFLSLTLWALRERGGADADRPPSPLPPWPLACLFLIWANVDSGFLVGLGTVALVWLGEALDRPADAGASGRLPTLLRRGCALGILAAVCLINPSHVNAFFGSPGAFPSPGQAASPFQRPYFATLGLTPAGLAYFPLLALGAVSFLLNVRRWRWRRALPWLGLALLSASQSKAIPFFAVVAGPMLAWNLQTWAAGLPARRSRSASPPYVLAVVMGVLLVVCAWPGWLQAPPFEPRHWAVEPPPSLERGALAARRWHQENKLTADGRGLHLSPESAYAFAWFCPEDKAVQDEALAGVFRGEPGATAEWPGRMRAAGIDHLILYDPDRDRRFATLTRLLSDPDGWPLLYVEGDLAVFGWRDPDVVGSQERFRDCQLDFNQLAFRPATDKTAPRQGPAAEAEVRPWWEALWKPAPPWRPVDQDEATFHLMHAEALRRTAPLRHLQTWDAGESAAVVAAAGGWVGPAGAFDAGVRLTFLRPQVPTPTLPIDALPVLDRLGLKAQQLYTVQHDDTPPALLYLAIRAARRAVAVNPLDAQAYLVLGESYLRLLRSTRERSWTERLPELAPLRRAQASAALNRALAIKPNFAQAHLVLSGLYRDMNYLDLTLSHLETYLKLVHEAGPPPGSDAAAFREEEARYQQELTRLTREVEDRMNSYAVGSEGMKVLDRAQLAVSKGLGAKARDMLLESDISAFGGPGMQLELELLLRTGRPREVWDWTGGETASQSEAALGTSSYHWLRAQALAASGEYSRAEDECTAMAGALTSAEQDQGPLPIRDVMALMVGQVVLDNIPGGRIRGLPAPSDVRRTEFDRQIKALGRNLRQSADVTVLRGLFALEEGRVEDAEVAFRTALTLWRDEAAAATGAGLDFNGRPIAQACLEWLE